jgi:drug/metabolite transporter (DMT)-like permease
LQPLLAAGLAYVQLGQGVTGAAGVSAVLILTGVGIVASGKRATAKVAISSDSPGK